MRSRRVLFVTVGLALFVSYAYSIRRADGTRIRGSRSIGPSSSVTRCRSTGTPTPATCRVERSLLLGQGPRRVAALRRRPWRRRGSCRGWLAWIRLVPRDRLDILRRDGRNLWPLHGGCGALGPVDGLLWGFSPGASLFAATAYGLATPAWAYATLFMGHAETAGCLMLAFAAAIGLAQRRTRRDAAIAPRLAHGFSSGWAVVTEFPARPCPSSSSWSLPG